jgi:hypothetical protein
MCGCPTFLYPLDVPGMIDWMSQVHATNVPWTYHGMYHLYHWDIARILIYGGKNLYKIPWNIYYGIAVTLHVSYITAIIGLVANG